MDDKLDLVSNLPYEILRHILSFLPLTEAVKSSTLSTVWRQLLAPLSLHLGSHNTKGLDLQTHDDATKEVKEALNRFLSSCICPERLKISLGIGEDRADSSKTEDVGFVVLATKGVEKELHLQFFENFKNETTKRFFHLNLTSSSNPSQSVSHFSSLKTLHLRSVNLHAMRLVSDVFAGCDLLESLKIDKCGGLQDLRVEAGNSLRSLTVLDCPDILSITVSAPNLKSFWYRGILPWLQLKSALDLVDATLDLRDGAGHNEFECEEVVSLLSSLKEVQSLTISGWLFEWMCTAGVIFGWLEFRFNKLKELCWVSSSMDGAKRDSLACFLNICPLLEKLFIEMDQSLGSIPCPFFHQHWHDPHLWMDFETVKFNTSQLRHLKMFKLSGFRGGEDELLLMELLLNKAVALESMIVI